MMYHIQTKRAAKDEVKPSEATDAIEPQQRCGGGRCGCPYGCCGWRYGRCIYCCRRPQAVESLEAEAVEANGVEPQQRGGSEKMTMEKEKKEAKP